MESVETANLETPKAPMERVVLDAETVSVLDSHIRTIQPELGDFIKVTRKQIVNFLLRRRADPLAPAEISELKALVADKETLFLAIAERVKSARKEGRTYSFDEDLKILNALSVNGNTQPKRRRRRRSLADENPDSNESDNSSLAATKSLEIGSGSSFEPQSPDSKKSKSLRKSTQEFDLENS